VLLGGGAGAAQGDDPAAWLRSGDKWNRVRAVEALARRGDESDWQAVLGALGDAKGEVADTAQLVLAGLPTTLVGELEGKLGLRSRVALVRERVAELLGRLPAPRLEALERCLKDDDATVRRMGAWSVERLARAGRVPDEARSDLAVALGRRVRSDREPLVQARALLALATLDPGAARRAVEEATRDRDDPLRAAAALAWPVVDAGEARDAGLVRLAGDDARAVRAAAVEALTGLGTRSGAAVLVGRLAAEEDARLRLGVLGALQGLSGLRYRHDARPWIDWLATLGEDWSPGRVARPETPPADPDLRSSALAGLPILSRRLAILIDLSGSIWNVRPDGTTRKQVIDAKLREALEGMDPETRFNLIPYTGEPLPWKPKLVPASRRNVRAAAEWFEGLHASGSGNVWDAAMLALEDEDVDTLVILFDGAPTGGARHRLELLVPLFLERTATRRVAVDLVLVDARRHLQEHWQRLADGSGGQLLAVSF
jgi:HEAT repeat protein